MLIACSFEKKRALLRISIMTNSWRILFWFIEWCTYNLNPPSDHGLIIDWIIDIKNFQEIIKITNSYLNKSISSSLELKNFIIEWGSEITNTNCILELYVLCRIYDIPIMVYDQNDVIVFIFHSSI